MKMLQRMALRTLIFALLSLLAFGLMERLTQLTALPEVMQGMKAAGILAWADITIMWLRVMMSPGLDVQATARIVDKCNDPHAAAMMYAVHQASWAVRLIAFIVLGWVL